MKSPPTARRKTPSAAAVAPDTGAMTIERVAQEAGVSPSTVSRILNGTAVVSGAKKQAVDDAIAKLGFVPNPMARGLAGGRTLSVGVVTQAIDSPFYGAALRGIEDELDPAGYSPLFVSGHWNATAEARCIDVLRSRRVDGIVVLTGRLPDQALIDCAKNLPVVVTGRTLDAPGLFALNFDNFEGGRLATRHLIELGHQRIAFIAGNDDHPDANERLRGYRAALESAGIVFDPALVVPGEYHEVSGLLAVNRLLEQGQRFTASLPPMTRWPLAPRWACSATRFGCPRMCPWSALTTCPPRSMPFLRSAPSTSPPMSWAGWRRRPCSTCWRANPQRWRCPRRA